VLIDPYTQLTKILGLEADIGVVSGEISNMPNPVSGSTTPSVSAWNQSTT